MLTAILLLCLQGLLGAFDTLYYHEYRLKLPHRSSAKRELRLHAARDFAYALLFGSIGWVSWNGLLAWVFAGILIAEIVITLADFVEEDRIRKLPAGERVMHALMGILYGLFLAALWPGWLTWMRGTTCFAPVSFGLLSWALTVMAAGVLGSGVRDLLSTLRPQLADGQP